MDVYRDNANNCFVTHSKGWKFLFFLKEVKNTLLAPSTSRAPRAHLLLVPMQATVASIRSLDCLEPLPPHCTTTRTLACRHTSCQKKYSALKQDRAILSSSSWAPCVTNHLRKSISLPWLKPLSLEQLSREPRPRVIILGGILESKVSVILLPQAKMIVV